MLRSIQAESSFRKTALFRRAYFENLVGLKVKTCYPWTNTSSLCKLTFTGLPQAIVDFSYHQETLEALSKLPQVIAETLKAILDERLIGGGEISMERLKKELFAPLQEKLEEGLKRLKLQMGDVTRSSEPGDDVPPSTPKPGFEWAKGHFRSTSKDYTLNPKLSCLDAWICYHLGEERNTSGEGAKKQISFTTPPWKMLQPADLKRVGSQRTYLFNLKFLCRKLDEAVGLSSQSVPSLSDLTKQFKSSDKLRGVLDSISTTKTGRVRRVEQVRWDLVARVLIAENNKPSTSKKRKASDTMDFLKRPKPMKKEVGAVGSTTDGMSTPVKKKTKTATKQAAVDDDDSVISVSPMSRPLSTKNNRKKRKRRSQYPRVIGPVPGEPDKGWVTVERNDMERLTRQGAMLSGTSTDAYLNVLSRIHYHTGVRRSCDGFMRCLDVNWEKYGSDGWYPHMMNDIVRGERGDHRIDWAEDPLICIQVFQGHPECGHWAQLVIDRTVWAPGILVLFDSLPNCFTGTLDLLKQRLGGSPLAPKGCKWLRATMPKQGLGTMDCGVWMCCMASLYVKGLVDRKVLPMLKEQVRADPPRAFTKVVVKASKDSTDIGGEGRQHMTRTVHNDTLSFDDAVFRHLSINWEFLGINP